MSQAEGEMNTMRVDTMSGIFNVFADIIGQFYTKLQEKDKEISELKKPEKKS
jgi:hypothetical protein